MSDLDIPRTHDGPPEDSSASVTADKYDQMLALADLFDTSGNEMRTRARLGTEILADDDVVDSGELTTATWGEAEEDIRAATTGKSGLSALLSGGEELLPSLFTLLSDRGQAADDLLPRTGVSPEWERLLSAAFIATPDYGTRSSTVVLVGRDRRVVFVERSFGPGGAPGEEVRHELEITAP